MVRPFVFVLLSPFAFNVLELMPLVEAAAVLSLDVGVSLVLTEETLVVAGLHISLWSRRLRFGGYQPRSAIALELVSFQPKDSSHAAFIKGTMFSVPSEIFIPRSSL